MTGHRSGRFKSWAKALENTMNVEELASQCCAAILTGQDITLSLPKGARWPHRFPRGELLSVGTNGSRNVRHDPIKVLAWVQSATLSAQAVHPGFTPSKTTMVTPEMPASPNSQITG